MPFDPDEGEANYRRVLAALARIKATDPRTHPLTCPDRLVALAGLQEISSS